MSTRDRRDGGRARCGLSAARRRRHRSSSPRAGRWRTRRGGKRGAKRGGRWAGEGQLSRTLVVAHERAVLGGAAALAPPIAQLCRHLRPRQAGLPQPQHALLLLLRPGAAAARRGAARRARGYIPVVLVATAPRGTITPDSGLRTWSEEEEQRMLRLRETGLTWPQVATQLGTGRSRGMCCNKYAALMGNNKSTGQLPFPPFPAPLPRASLPARLCLSRPARGCSGRGPFLAAEGASPRSEGRRAPRPPSCLPRLRRAPR